MSSAVRWTWKIEQTKPQRTGLSAHPQCVPSRSKKERKSGGQIGFWNEIIFCP
jgi:hypothetical protein